MNKHSKWGSFIMIISSVIFTLTALITVMITISSWKTHRETARPYLTLKDSPLIRLQEDINFEFNFVNVGVHPAFNMSSKTIVFNENLKIKPVHIDEYAIANDIPNNTSTSLLINMKPEEFSPDNPTVKPYYIVIALHYTDPVINKNYDQTIYLKWSGISAGATGSIFHVKVNEKNNILNYLNDQNIKLKIAV
ncbi:MAG: hypothetical protein PHZ11_05445 [Desulfitobacteriaceae bacterium]|nr:hypothetical protein [Desulfitobacteriaceae bacterium]MDD4400576.1 hypothetical protein [Desulfitobacteriaceae bacterium]